MRRKAHHGEKVFKALRGEMTASDVSQKTGLDSAQVHHAFYALMRSGEVRRQHNGKGWLYSRLYSLTPRKSKKSK